MIFVWNGIRWIWEMPLGGSVDGKKAPERFSGARITREEQKGLRAPNKFPHRKSNGLSGKTNCIWRQRRLLSQKNCSKSLFF